MDNMGLHAAIGIDEVISDKTDFSVNPSTDLQQREGGYNASSHINPYLKANLQYFSLARYKDLERSLIKNSMRTRFVGCMIL